MTAESKLNFSAGGVHEVAALRSDGALVAGHFDSANAADAAIAALGDYRAVWSTLNPVAVLPSGRTLNPTRLTRGSRAGAQHIERRTSLMLDFDPPRPAANTMSTAAELEAALQQATDCRAWLRSLGWPLLPLCLSGSGYHLRPRVEMGSELARRLLESLRHRYSFVDVGMFDLPRLCRYYGTWNRKSAENTAERPWRQSAVIDSGDVGALVSREQIASVIAKIGLPTIPTFNVTEKPNSAAVDRTIRQLAEWLDKIGVVLTEIVTLGDGRTLLRLSHCPANPDHNGSSAGIGVSVSGRPQNFCRHSSCGMPWSEWLRSVEQKHGVKFQIGPRLIFKNGAK